MVIGRVLPESLSSSTSHNALSESTSNNILKTLNVNPNINNSSSNKYSSRLQSISPIKLTNSIDSNGSDEETTNATTIHISNNNNDNKNNNSNSRSNLLNIFTPNTATTAVDSNYSDSNKGDNNKKSANNIHKQEMKLKKLRKFTENSKLVEEDMLKNSTISSDNIQQYSAQEINTDYFHLGQGNQLGFQEYYNGDEEEEDANYFEEDIQRFNRNKGLPFGPVEKRRQPLSKKKSTNMKINNKQQLRFVDNNVYEEVDDLDNDDEFNNDFQNYAFLVEQHERLLYEQQQLKIQQEKVKQLSRSTSLRNLQHNMRSSIKADSPVKQQRVLSRSSSRNALNSYLPQQQQQQHQVMGLQPRLSNAKSMMNLRSSFNHRKSVSNNHHNIVYEEDDLMEEIEPAYSNPTPNQLYAQQRNPMPKFKSMNNLRIASLREENQGPSRKQAAYLRPRVSSSSLYQPQLEEDELEYETNYDYNYEYEYENDFMDDTFQQDFQSQHIPFTQPRQQLDDRRIVDYWSLPQETNPKPFKRNQRLQYELQPLRGNPVSKLDQLRSFREQQQQQQTTMHKPIKAKQLKIIPKQAAKYKDGDKSGIMTYDAIEKRWVGNASILEDLEYLPDAGKYKQISQLQPPQLSHPFKAQRHGMGRSMSYHNFKHEIPERVNIDIDIHFPSNVLAEWYSFEVGLDKKLGHWLSMRDGEGDVNDWEIYDLVLGSNS